MVRKGREKYGRIILLKILSRVSLNFYLMTNSYDLTPSKTSKTLLIPGLRLRSLSQCTGEFASTLTRFSVTYCFRYYNITRITAQYNKFRQVVDKVRSPFPSSPFMISCVDTTIFGMDHMLSSLLCVFRGK